MLPYLFKMNVPTYPSFSSSVECEFDIALEAERGDFE